MREKKGPGALPTPKMTTSRPAWNPVATTCVDSNAIAGAVGVAYRQNAEVDSSKDAVNKRVSVFMVEFRLLDESVTKDGLSLTFALAFTEG